MKEKTILKMPPYYFPEQISSSHLTEDLNNAFCDADFHTVVITPTPCRGIDNETRHKYQKRRHEIQIDKKIDIYRFPLYREGKNIVGRAIRYLLCNLIQYYKGIHQNSIDIVFSGSTPPTQGLLCGKVARKISKKNKYKVPFVYNLQDVFPDSLVSTGITKKESLLWKVGRIIEDRTYKLADTIIVISNDIKQNIMMKGVPENKIVVIPNWVDTSEVHPVLRDNNQLYDELDIDKSKFIVSYAGNMGASQGIDTIIQAAKKLKTNKNISFVLFGGGSKFDHYAKLVAGMENVKLYPLQSPDRISEVYSLGDVSVVACRWGVGAGAVPSKSLSIMATGTPILLSFDEGTELWQLIKENNSGFLAEAENVDSLVEQILIAYNNPSEIRNKGINALNLVRRNYSKANAMDAYVSIMKSIVRR